MENRTQSFREANLALQLIWELQIKNETVISRSSRKKKEGIFVSFISSEGIFFNICVLS